MLPRNFKISYWIMITEGEEHLSVSLASRPGLSSDPSRNGGGLCGRQAAIRTIRRITSPPIAIPRIAALEIDTADKTGIKKSPGTTIFGNGRFKKSIITSYSWTRNMTRQVQPTTTKTRIANEALEEINKAKVKD